MVSKTPPTPGSGGTPNDPNIDSKVHVPGKGFKAKPMTFLGQYYDSEQATKLWQVIVQSVNQSIQKNESDAIKAIRQMGGRGDDEGGGG